MKRGQPKKEIKRTAVKLSLLPSIRAKGDRLAFLSNKSLSRLFEDLIEQAFKIEEAKSKIKQAN
jgi:hypothetical protein